MGSALRWQVFAALARAGLDPDAIWALPPRLDTASDFVEGDFTVKERGSEFPLDPLLPFMRDTVLRPDPQPTESVR